MPPLKLPASYYQQFDADTSREVPGEGYGGWQKSEIELAPDHTALVVMHAWDCGEPEQWPGWRRAVEYYPRALKIAEEVFPDLFAAVRTSPLRIFHVVGGHDYYRSMPGYQKTLEIAGPSPEFKPITKGPVYERMQTFRGDHVFVGAHNQADCKAGLQELTFLPSAQPQENELIAEDSHQLAALCRHHGINHLVYTGFAINWCLLMSPGGMVEMDRYGIMCSTIREAVTAVENAETAREEREKQQALWRVALAFGFVFGVDDFKTALRSTTVQ